jgi:hypothetical protein
MAPFFPQVTGAFRIEETPAFRRFTMSIVEMALVTGVVLRMGRALALTAGPNDNLVFIAAAVAAGLAWLCGMATLHLGNYTLTRWIWRAPTFVLIEAIAESLTSLALIALHREPLGSARATFADWPAITFSTFLWRLIAVLAYAAVLAGVVQLVRYALVKHDHREHTLDAVHGEAE